MQRGNIELRGNTWLLKYYEPIKVDGKIVKRQKAVKIATYSEKYHDKEQVQHFADAILAPINSGTEPGSVDTVAAFFKHVYLKHVKEKKKPSTAQSYQQMFYLVEPFLGDLKMKDVKTVHIQRLMESVAESKQRAHTTHRNVKSFLSAGFRYAKQIDAIRGENPVRDSEVPRGKSQGKLRAYKQEDIQKLIAVIPEPVKTAVLVAALTGLRVSEIKGLRWEDVGADELRIERSVWSGHVTDTKTITSRAPVPLLPIVKKALEAHRKRSTGDGFIFHGNTGKPLRLENVLRRDIKPILDKKKLPWLGWHAFRRGFGTNLYALGVDAKTISTILRHSDVAVTQKSYMNPVAKKSRKAMQKLALALKRTK